MILFRIKQKEEKCQGRVMIKTCPTRWRVLPLEEITHVKGNGKESRFFTVRGKSYRSHGGLGEIYSELQNCGFWRSHRSYLVNLDRIEQMVRRSASSWELVMEGKATMRVPVGDGYSVKAMRQVFRTD